MSVIREVDKAFNKSLIASLTSKNAVLKEVRDCIIQSDEDKLKHLNLYLYSYLRDLQVSSSCVFMDEKVAIPNALKEALIEDLYASHPAFVQWFVWPNIAVGQTWTAISLSVQLSLSPAIGENLKSAIPVKQFQFDKTCIVSNQEIQIDFAGPINNEKEHEIFILTFTDRFFKYQSAEIFENANTSNVIKFLTIINNFTEFFVF